MRSALCRWKSWRSTSSRSHAMVRGHLDPKLDVSVYAGCYKKHAGRVSVTMPAGAVNLMRHAKRSTNRDVRLTSFQPITYMATRENEVCC